MRVTTFARLLWQNVCPPSHCDATLRCVGVSSGSDLADPARL